MMWIGVLAGVGFVVFLLGLAILLRLGADRAVGRL